MESHTNKYKVVCSDYINNRNYTLVHEYYFYSLDKAQKAKKIIESGGNKAVIKEVK